MAVNTYRKDEESFGGSKKNILLRVLKYYAEYKAKIVLVIFLILLSSLIITVIPKFSEYAIDVNVAQGDIHGLIITCSISAALSLLLWLVMVVRERTLARITNEIVYKIRREAFDHLQTLSLYYFDSRPTGKILSRLINDVSSLKDMLTRLIAAIIPNVALIVLITIVLFASNAQLALSVLIVIPFLVVFIYFVTVKGFVNWESFRKKNSNMNAYTHESYTGIRVIQAFGAEREATEEADRVMDDVRKGWVKAVRRADLLNIVIAWSQGLGYFVLYFFAVKWLRLGSSSVGELVAFATYMTLFWQPIRSLAAMYNQLTNQITGAGRVFELLDTESILQEKENAGELVVSDGRVEFDHINFAYPDEPGVEILSNLSFVAEPGQMIALVGPTGAGKTTIVNLLVRFYDPVKGTVRIDGQDISSVTLASLRRNIGVMTQEPFLFSGTIRENLTYGKTDATDEEVISACRRLGLEDFILMQNGGLDAVVSQDTMSQGQKQLIALARTLIADPKVLLLDEATSAIDTRTEQLVQAGMSILMKGRTSFVVAHRLSTIVNADRIMVISNKGIAEEGTHRELLKKNGLYADLYNSQFEELS
ncbi:MAG: ABC transporter ATP-binding protein/permease [Sphaerochaetaceae bacterium]|nr:ABC transporter ATP-binding protein/permease [Sphaerochaetaceae bacterium]